MQRRSQSGAVNPRPIPERPAPVVQVQEEVPPAPKPEPVPDFVQRMQRELEELNGRILKLEEFLDSEKYKSVGGAEEQLICFQYGAMLQYRGVLSQRLAIHKQNQEAP
ncbi:crAss001_48 related protein [Microbulbifer sp. VVAC002]|uniref:crAss001_48 related protein n=1 Tax=Microbulbifer sp. VVAC002 TaxID=3243387 RepID=UPI0040397DE9